MKSGSWSSSEAEGVARAWIDVNGSKVVRRAVQEWVSGKAEEAARVDDEVEAVPDLGLLTRVMGMLVERERGGKLVKEKKFEELRFMREGKAVDTQRRIQHG